MVIVDANVLLYATNESMPQHPGARRWIEAALSGVEAVGFAWIVLLAFLRLSTLPALFPRPLQASTALDVVDNWLSAAPALAVHPTLRHAVVLRGLLTESGTAGNLVTDAHVAALCLEHGASICTYDRDFNRFPRTSSVLTELGWWRNSSAKGECPLASHIHDRLELPVVEPQSPTRHGSTAPR